MTFSKIWIVGIWAATVLIVLQGFLPPVAKSTTANPISEKRDLAEISQVRRMLRSACAKIRMINAETNDVDALFNDVKAETDRAMMHWGAFYSVYVDGAPSSYAGHPNWYEAAEAIEKSIAEMANAARDKDVKTALARCGSTCLKFVEMNDAAGIELTTDILFRFRKSAKPLLKTIRNNDLVTMAPAVQTLLSLKKQAMMQHVNGLGTSVKGSDAMKRFSESVDAFAAASATDGAGLDARYREMMSSMEKAYDRYL